MTTTWEPGIAQAMQRHGGTNRSVPKVKAPTIQPDAKPTDVNPPMAQQGVPLVPVVLPEENRRGSPCAVIQGGDEKAKGEVQIKDLILGAGLTAIKDRDEYLRKQAEAQFAAPVDKLVDSVRQVLTRHGVSWN